MIEFIPPSFLEENDVDSILERMQNTLPPDIVSTPGSMAYNFLQPTAIEKSEILEHHLQETLMLMFPMWAYGEWLDEHAKIAGIKRKEGGFSRGSLTVTGPSGTVIEAGSIFTTEGTDDVEEKEYRCELEYQIGDTGEIQIEVVAEEIGEAYNANIGTIVLMDEPLDGVSVVNQEVLKGGLDIEDDESLRDRIQQINESIEVSYVGSIADYKRWARECPHAGVEDCVVQDTNDRPGLVRLIIIGKDGRPIPESIPLVKKYIEGTDADSPEGSEDRLMPIGGVTLEVTTVSELVFHYQAVIVRKKENSLDEIKNEFRNKVLAYYKEAKKEGVLKYHKISAILSLTKGISDFTDLQYYVSNEMDAQGDESNPPEEYIRENIPIRSTDYPVIGKIHFIEREG